MSPTSVNERYHCRTGASTFGSPISPTNFLRRHFHPLLKKCGIKEGFTFYGLRPPCNFAFKAGSQSKDRTRAIRTYS